MKRHNRLWTNDTIHLRKTLEIPQNDMSPKSQSSSHSNNVSETSVSMDKTYNRVSVDSATSFTAPHSPRSNASHITAHSEPSYPSIPHQQSPASLDNLLRLIDQDVNDILEELERTFNTPQRGDTVYPPVPIDASQVLSLRTRPAGVRRSETPIELWTTSGSTARVTILPLDTKTAATQAAMNAPLKVLFEWTPLFSDTTAPLPETMKETLEADIRGRLQKQLSHHGGCSRMVEIVTRRMDVSQKLAQSVRRASIDDKTIEWVDLNDLSKS